MSLPDHVLGNVKIFADAWDYSASPTVRAKGNVEVVSETVLIQADEIVVHADKGGSMDFRGETHLRKLPGTSN
jgi:lipopolysaccharide export system protein LptA